MNIQKITKTKIAALVLLAHIVYIATFFAFLLLAGAFEFICNRSGIYEILAIIAIFLLILYPIAATVINSTSVFFQVLALKNHESKLPNIVLMIIAILCEIVMIILSYVFWQGAMGV